MIMSGVLLFVFQDTLFYTRTEVAQKPVEILGPFPDVSLLGLDGRNHIISDIISENVKNKRTTIVSLWATWCGPCTTELPLLKKALPKLKEQGVEVVLVNYDDGDASNVVKEVKAWLISQGLEEVGTLFDFKQELMDKLDVSALPFAVKIGVDGKMKWKRSGQLSWASPELAAP